MTWILDMLERNFEFHQFAPSSSQSDQLGVRQDIQACPNDLCADPQDLGVVLRDLGVQLNVDHPDDPIDLPYDPGDSHSVDLSERDQLCEDI